MKKQLLLAMAIIGLSFNLSAQTWNFSEVYPDAATVKVSHTTTTTVEGLTIYAEAGKAIDFDKSGKTFEDEKFTVRLKFGGTSAWDEAGETPLNRVISFPVSGNTTITVVGTHASSEGTPRTLMCTAGSKENVVGDFAFSPSVVDKATFNYEGDATTIYLFSAASGINLYKVSAIPAGEGGSTGIVDSSINKEVVSVEYYNAVGVRTKESTKGLNLVKSTMSDGSVTVEKIYIP